LDVYTTYLRVRYAETDTMGVVYYANYLVYFETARVEFLRAAGADYRALEAEGFLAPVLEAHCRYHAAAYFDDLLAIEARLIEMRRTRFRFSYRVEREADHTLIAEGQTGHVWLDARSRRPVPAPPRLLAILAATNPRSDSRLADPL
jgi:acyl-CoA thioester hydrolase